MFFGSSRRIAQWQSASLNTEEVAAFDSCSAYQFSLPGVACSGPSTGGADPDSGSRPALLFLSHCVPDPPDKGERIRAYHILRRLAGRYRVHLACFARSLAEIDHARRLEGLCASVHVEPLPRFRTAFRAFSRFALGSSLTASYYGSPGMLRHATRLRVDAAVVYSSVMGAYVPAGTPLVADFVDVDSEKWIDYGRTRRPGFAYSLEGRRLQRLERNLVARAARTFVTTRAELELLRRVAPSARTGCFENGVDFAYFDPRAELARRPAGNPTVVFVGEMSYFPNADAACWFARACLPELRRRQPRAEFLAVGRNPPAAVRRLRKLEGVSVTGGVPDVRPYLASAAAVVAPLRMARGIQNKVLEALAMGKRVYASAEVCATFEPGLPYGLVRCDSPAEWADALSAALERPPWCDPAIRGAARDRFSWDRNTGVLLDAVEDVLRAPRPTRLPS